MFYKVPLKYHNQRSLTSGKYIMSHCAACIINLSEICHGWNYGLNISSVSQSASHKANSITFPELWIFVQNANKNQSLRKILEWIHRTLDWDLEEAPDK